MKRVLATAALLTLSGCGPDDRGVPPPPAPIQGDLAVEIRDTAHVVLTGPGLDIQAALTLSKGYGLAPAGAEITGMGHVEAFPEADATLYTARIDAPPDPSGPCGAQPISLALSLHRRGKGAHVGGALTAYCGQGTWHGIPARVLRLSGDLPLKP
jgi:hypothetical protein